MRTLTTFLLAIALANVAAATTHTVNIVGLTFSPDEIMIQQGDTVDWVHDASTIPHTVTDGGGPGDPGAGSYFDATLSTPNQVFSYTFALGGDYPYFCRFHFGSNMIGVVHVTPGVPTESTTWSSVKALYR